MRKWTIDQAEVDATKIIEDTDDFLVVPAIIAREGVFKHPEGMVYYPADELKRATWTLDGAWIVPEKHPDTTILTSPDEIVGRVEKPFFCEKINGNRGNLRFDKKRAKPEFLAEIRSGKRKDVSWGYYYDEDLTPGEWKGQHYDQARRKFLVDHLAAGVPVGRCSSPRCGIAVDAMFVKYPLFPTVKFKSSDGKEIVPGEWADLFDRLPARFFFPATDNVGADPWEETDDYIRSGHKEPGETCRTIDISETQGIKAIYCKYGEDWAIQSYLFSKAKDWTMEKAKTWFQEHKEAADAEWDTEYINNLPDSCFAVISAGGKKDDQGKTVPRSLRHLPYKNADGGLNEAHVRNGLSRLPQTDLSTEDRAQAKRNLCMAAKELKLESEVCKTEAADCPDPERELERTRRLLEEL